jgi:hypothetical protein
VRQTALVVAIVLALSSIAVAAQEIPPPERRGDVETPPGVPLEDAGSWEVFEDVVAWVNDEIITMSDLAEAESELSRALMGQLSGNELENALQEGRSRLLYNLIERRLLIQEAHRMYDFGKMRESLLEQFKDGQGIESEEEMNRWLRAQGMTQDELLQKLVDYSVPGFVVRAEVTDRLAVSDADVEAYFEENQHELSEAATVSFREIALGDEGADPEEVRARAETIAGDARSGVDFAELAGQVSESPSKQRGGLVGPLEQADLAPWLVDPLAGLEMGAVSDPIRTPYGWVILRLESREEALPPTLEGQRVRIEELIRQERYPVALGEFVLKVWNGSEIEVTERFVERLPTEWRGRVQVRR